MHCSKNFGHNKSQTKPTQTNHTAPRHSTNFNVTTRLCWIWTNTIAIVCRLFGNGKWCGWRSYLRTKTTNLCCLNIESVDHKGWMKWHHKPIYTASVVLSIANKCKPTQLFTAQSKLKPQKIHLNWMTWNSHQKLEPVVLFGCFFLSLLTRCVLLCGCVCVRFVLHTKVAENTRKRFIRCSV